MDQAAITALHTWQRGSKDVQILLRLGAPPPEWSSERAERAAAAINSLASSIEAGRTTRPVRVFRGIRDFDVVAGPSFNRPGDRATLAGFVATTLDADVTAEFIPTRGGILAIDLPPGTPALEVCDHSLPEFAHQQELLLADGLVIEYVGRSTGAQLSNLVQLADRVVVEARIAS